MKKLFLKSNPPFGLSGKNGKLFRSEQVFAEELRSKTSTLVVVPKAMTSFVFSVKIKTFHYNLYSLLQLPTHN